MVKMGVPRVINRVLGIVPTVANWDTDPTNLERATDNDWTTVTGTGQTALLGAGDVGQLIFDLGVIRTVLIGAKFGEWVTASSLSCYLEYSLDGIAWVQWTDAVHTGMAGGVEQFRFPKAHLVRLRYFRFKWYLNGAGTANVKIYEVQALEFQYTEGRN